MGGPGRPPRRGRVRDPAPRPDRRRRGDGRLDRRHPPARPPRPPPSDPVDRLQEGPGTRAIPGGQGSRPCQVVMQASLPSGSPGPRRRELRRRSASCHPRPGWPGCGPRPRRGEPTRRGGCGCAGDAGCPSAGTRRPGPGRRGRRAGPQAPTGRARRYSRARPSRKDGRRRCPGRSMVISRTWTDRGERPPTPSLVARPSPGATSETRLASATSRPVTDAVSGDWRLSATRLGRRSIDSEAASRPRWRAACPARSAAPGHRRRQRPPAGAASGPGPACPSPYPTARPGPRSLDAVEGCS
jgi:hypothetical protein